MINLVKKYLQISRYSFQKENFEELYMSHPNYPSLFSITDSLDLIGIENLSVKIPKEQFDALPTEFMCLFEDQFALVIKKGDQVVVENEKGIQRTISINTFLDGWKDIVLLIEPNSTFSQHKHKKHNSWLLYTLPVVLLILLSIYYKDFTIVSYYLLCTSLLGLGLSFFILQESFGIKNEVVSKFCEINTATSCNEVIGSSNGKISKNISFSDLPFLFFSTGLVALLLEPKIASTWIVWFSVVAIPVILYSLWLQKFKLKKWCVLCLVISVIVVMQSLVFWFTTTSFSFDFLSEAYIFIFSAVIIGVAWFSVKPVWKQKIDLEKSSQDLMKFKRKFELFQFLSKKIESYQGFDTLQSIRFGSQEGPVKLSLILSPSCGHCHKAFQQAYALVQKFPSKIDLQILFNINPENKENPYKKVVESLLSLSRNCPELVEEALVDWHINNLDLEKWNKKWGVDIPDMLVNHEMLKQYQWCVQNNFNFTPVKLINGMVFPDEYEIAELKYFINNFSETVLEEDNNQQKAN